MSSFEKLAESLQSRAAGKAVLAFAHANGVPDHSYDTFLAPLSGSYELAVIPCLGHQPDYPVDAGWASLTDELEAALALLPKPLVGVGHSMGAVLMFLVAQRQPHWFSALVMLDPPLLNGLYGLAMRLATLLGQQDRFTPAGKSKGRLDYWPDWSAVESYFQSRGFFRAFDSRCLQDYLKAGVVETEQGWQLRFRPQIEVEIFRTTPTRVTAMPPLSIPAALITGKNSPKPFHQCAERHCRRHHMVHLLAEGGHMFPLENPQATASLLVGVLQQLRGGEPEMTAQGARHG